MSKELHIVFIRGKSTEWGIETYITKEAAAALSADGLMVGRVEGSIPKWAVDAGIPVRLWFFVQDVFYFRNPWRK